MIEHRVFVTTIEGNPSFLVSSIARDEFIDSLVEGLLGAQESGEAHEWEAHEVETAKGVA